jgi:prepilin-type N-terminal cleavage/methylation domain-containing protein/prepilin-type processing-associated H-X9-DG protein
MKPMFSKPRPHAFTLIEMALVMAIVVIWLGLLLPALHRPRTTCATRINCASNLKQVGIAFHVWANDHEDKFPWQLSTNKGGTLEYAASAEAFRHFQIASNELSNPKVLICRSDEGRRRDDSFTNQFSNANLSYFIGVEADERLPQTILAGDRNITGGPLTVGRILVLTTNSPAGWGTDIHKGNGNIGLADGSVQQVTERGLRRQVENALISGDRTCLRLAIP